MEQYTNTMWNNIQIKNHEKYGAFGKSCFETSWLQPCISIPVSVWLIFTVLWQDPGGQEKIWERNKSKRSKSSGTRSLGEWQAGEKDGEESLGGKFVSNRDNTEKRFWLLFQRSKRCILRHLKAEWNRHFGSLNFNRMIRTYQKSYWIPLQWKDLY